MSVSGAEPGIHLGPGREFDRIRAIVAALGPGAAAVGDDCALLRWGETLLAVSTDASIEGVHFRLDWLTHREVGWRAAAAALSDLAAEGAEPIGVLVALVAPRAAEESEPVAVMEGVSSAAASVGGSVLGGDLSAGPCWALAVTVLGHATRPVTRAGARPGDRLWVTGALGAARAALEAWRRGAAPAPAARAAFVQPEPRITPGRWLAAHGARAMIDLSDGLGGDAQHLAAASGVALELDLERVPVAGGVHHEAVRLGVPAAQFAAEGGEDYELLVALPESFGEAEAELFVRECGVPLTRIGRAVAGTGVRARLSNAIVSLSGYDHFG